jgi:hypothetical protein
MFKIKSCCENKYCNNKKVIEIISAINENAAWNTSNELNFYSDNKCELCENYLFYFYCEEEED